MPTILIIAGPNGAGKTTFANRWFTEQGIEWPYLNADEIGREEFGHLAGVQRDMAAGRQLIAELEALVAQRADFAVETTLSSQLYARRIPAWRAHGYRIELAYIRLADADASIRRVAHRVSQGGHGVATDDLLRRFGRSIRNLEDIYKPLVDEWGIWESRDGGVTLVDRSLP